MPRLALRDAGGDRILVKQPLTTRLKFLVLGLIFSLAAFVAWDSAWIGSLLFLFCAIAALVQLRSTLVLTPTDFRVAAPWPKTVRWNDIASFEPYPGIASTQIAYRLRDGRRRAIQGGIFGDSYALIALMEQHRRRWSTAGRDT